MNRYTTLYMDDDGTVFVVIHTPTGDTVKEMLPAVPLFAEPAVTVEKA